LPRRLIGTRAPPISAIPEAQYNLGIAYIEGVGVSYDPFKANAYFEKAAAQGIMEAAYNLGLIYENGLLGKPQPEEALVWYKNAADKGSPEAKAALEQLAKTLNIGVDEINEMVEDVRAGQGSHVCSGLCRARAA
jgi:TPR repeat protein